MVSGKERLLVVRQETHSSITCKYTWTQNTRMRNSNYSCNYQNWWNECVSLSIGDRTVGSPQPPHMPPLLCLIFPQFLRHVWRLSKRRPVVQESVYFVRYTRNRHGQIERRYSCMAMYHLNNRRRCGSCTRTAIRMIWYRVW